MKWLRFTALFPLCWHAASAQIPAPHPFFDGDAVHEIRLRFSQPDWYQQLSAHYSGVVNPGEYLSASFEWKDAKFDSIGVRFKGSSSYLAADTRKKPFRLKLNEFVSGQKIEGLDSFNLNNAWNDPSFVREKPYYEMAAEMGLKAPRSNFAALYINGEYWGLYVLGEVIDKEFLESRFGSGKEDDGNLYKGNLGATFEYLGEDPAPYRAVWEKQTNEDDDDWSDLIALCKLISDSTPENLRAKLEPVADVDSILTALALDNATVNIDSYVGMAQNFNIYRRPSDGRWVWLVWDPSLAFGSLGQGISVEGLQRLPLEWITQIVGGQAGSGNARPLATKLWAVPEYRARYLQIYRNLVDRVFLAESILSRMTALREMIRPYVSADWQKLVSYAEFDAAMSAPDSGVLGDEAGEHSAPGLRPLIEGRIAFLRATLSSQAITGMPRITSEASALSFSMAAGTSKAASQTLRVGASGTPASFYSVSVASEPESQWLKVTPTGGPAPGAITVSAGDSQLAPGIYIGTIQIDAPAAVNSPLRIPVSLLVTGAGESQPGPVIQSVVNAASYEPGAVAPGQIVTLFGSGLGPSNLVTGSLAGDRWLSPSNHLEVAFDDFPAPALYASEFQSTVVVPFEVAGREKTIMRVRVLGAETSITVPVAASRPGIFTVDASGLGQSAAVLSSGAVNGPSAPAAKGSTVALFLTGGGPLMQAGVTGGVGRTGPFQEITAPVSVLIGGQPATITYKGAAPGAVQGLYQVNAVVPESVPSGSVPIRVIVGGESSQSGVTLMVQ